jgi:hypothetical protein
VAALASVRCSGCRNGLRPTTSSAKGPGGRRDAHQGLGSGGAAAQGGRRRGPSGGSALAEEVDAGVPRAPGLHGSARGRPAKVLRELGRSGERRRRGIEVAWQNTGGGPRVQFRPLHGPGSRVKASGSFLAPRRSYSGVSKGGGAVGRRVRGGAGSFARQSKAAVALGLRWRP